MYMIATCLGSTWTALSYITQIQLQVAAPLVKTTHTEVYQNSGGVTATKDLELKAFHLHHRSCWRRGQNRIALHRLRRDVSSICQGYPPNHNLVSTVDGCSGLHGGPKQARGNPSWIS